MLVLHAADSVAHLGAPSILGFAIAGLGVGVGAFFVFGMPALLHRRRDGGAIASDGADENTERPD